MTHSNKPTMPVVSFETETSEIDPVSHGDISIRLLNSVTILEAKPIQYISLLNMESPRYLYPHETSLFTRSRVYDGLVPVNEISNRIMLEHAEVSDFVDLFKASGLVQWLSLRPDVVKLATLVYEPEQIDQIEKEIFSLLGHVAIPLLTKEVHGETWAIEPKLDKSVKPSKRLRAKRVPKPTLPTYDTAPIESHARRPRIIALTDRDSFKTVKEEEKARKNASAPGTPDFY